jgi:hypothetical protein
MFVQKYPSDNFRTLKITTNSKNLCVTCDIHLSYSCEWLEGIGWSQNITPVTPKLCSFPTSALDEGEWSASCHSCCTPKERVPHYPLNRRLGSAQNSSVHFGEEMNLSPMPGIKLRFLTHPVHSLITILTLIYV